MAFGDIVQSKDLGSYASSGTLDLAVTAGNTIFVVLYSRDGNGGLPTSITDSLNGNYTRVINVGLFPEYVIQAYMLSGSAAGSPTATFDDNAYRGAMFEVEGAMSAVAASGSGKTVSSTAITTTSDTIPAGSFSFAAIGGATTGTWTFDSPWVAGLEAAGLYTVSRTDSASVSDSLSGTISSAVKYSAGWASFTAASTAPSVRIGQNLTVSETLAGTITGATLNGSSISIVSQTSPNVTVNTTGSGITTSGQYNLVLTDNTAATETIAVQVDVVGLPSNNFNKDGANLAGLTDIEVDVFNASGSLVEQLTGQTTDFQGDTGVTNLSSITEPVGHTLKISMYSPSEKAGITFEQALELI